MRNKDVMCKIWWRRNQEHVWDCLKTLWNRKDLFFFCVLTNSKCKTCVEMGKNNVTIKNINMKLSTFSLWNLKTAMLQISLGQTLWTEWIMKKKTP